MRRIHTLSEHVVSKIAAGEVIERPAFAVKELIENAIDARADFIEITVEGAGLKKITVTDNGDGMSKEDLEICFLPHTTSKIQDEEHLLGIRTLGFRGEALSSISAVSQMTVKSRQSRDVGGTCVKIKNGACEEISSVGLPIGTTVHIEHLFSSVPARKKFLKTEKTEFRHITDIVSCFALSHPRVHFTLTHNKKKIVDFPSKENNTERVNYVIGESFSDLLIPVSYEDDYIKIEGAIGKPQAALKRNLKQFLFVNNRSITDKLISLSVRESYGTLLPQSSTPIFFLTVQLPHEMVDVNVHPRKEHVSFSHPKLIFDAFKQAVSEALTDHNITFRLAKFKHETSEKLGETSSFSGTLLKKEVVREDIKSLGNVTSSKNLMQHNNTYIIAQTENGLYFFDQHAAHERILYEEFLKTFNTTKKKKETYQLKKPVTLKLSASDSQIFDEYVSFFEQMGFEIEHFQGTGVIFRTVPLVFKGRNIQKIVMDMLSDFQERNDVTPIDMRTNRMLMFLSCRAAVKSGDPLNENQMKKVISHIGKTENNSTCPHGRPTHIAVSQEELDTWFKRR